MHDTFLRTLCLPVSPEVAFAWHERPGALERLIPPWENIAVEKRSNGIGDGQTVHLIQHFGPLRFKWIARHHGYSKPREFRDSLIKGPFPKWEHTHRFEATANGQTLMTDSIEYELPGGALGRLLTQHMVREKLNAMFDYRHATVLEDLKAHAAARFRNFHFAVTGSNGLVGSALIPFLTTGGHRVTRLVRGKAGDESVHWNPRKEFDGSKIDGVDVVIHLAGKSIAGKRWTDRVKHEIRESREVGTRLLCEGLSKMPKPPQVLIAASAIGYYGDRGSERLTEDAMAGDGFLPDVCLAWESATSPAADAGIRVVNLRFGLILSPRDGAMSKMLTPFKLGLGGRVGNGRQFWSWVSIEDVLGAIHHAVNDEALHGPINVVAPQPVTNAEFTKSIGKVLNRPTWLRVPRKAASLAMGEMADPLLFASARVEPHRLMESGYSFRHSHLDQALRHLLGKTPDSGRD